MQIPFFNNEELKQRAQEFRSKFWDGIIPVNIEYIIEFKLGIKIIPILGLYKQCNADALIASDWQTIYVDNDNYLDDKYYNRLRFSLAHEIGHLVLHRDLYISFSIKSIEDIYNIIEKIGQEYGIIEGHANRFANFLLVPRDRLSVLALYGFLQSVGIFFYVSLVVWFMSTAGKMAGGNMWIGVIMLMLFIFSAAITGLLFFGYAFFLYFRDEKKDAIKLVGLNLAFLFILTLILFVIKVV